MKLEIEVKQVLRMKEGTDETSYAKTSYIQKQVLSLTKSVKEKAIHDLYCSREQPATLCIADLGCSSAVGNTLTVVSELIDTVEKARRELGNGPVQYQICLNDLPGNDFNTIFRSLTSFEERLKKQMGDDFGHCFVNGVPGSFHGRLFPTNSLYFVHSSYSVHWLSQVPQGIEDNKENIYMGRTSPPHILKAYYDQFAKDFSTFLRCRSQEVVAGGKMVLTLFGSKSSNVQHSYKKESCYMWELLATVLNDMVLEGLVDEKKLNTFNFPHYSPSAAELGYLAEEEGSFTINQVHESEVNWKASAYDKSSYNKSFDHIEFAKCMRSISEPLLINHFGETIIEDLFQRYREIIRVSMAKEKNVFINVTIYLTRKD